MSDTLLLVWIVGDFIWGGFVFGLITYVVFWRDQSGWWYVIAMLFCSSTTLFKVLAKRYGIEEGEERDGK